MRQSLLSRLAGPQRESRVDDAGRYLSPRQGRIDEPKRITIPPTVVACEPFALPRVWVSKEPPTAEVVVGHWDEIVDQNGAVDYPNNVMILAVENMQLLYGK